MDFVVAKKRKADIRICMKLVRFCISRLFTVLITVLWILYDLLVEMLVSLEICKHFENQIPSSFI